MNWSSSNNEIEHKVTPHSIEEKIGFTVAYLAILLVAVIGNSFVIHVARKLLSAGRGPFNILVINMATSDILYAFTVIAFQVKYSFVGQLWFPGGFGTILCKFVFFTAVFAMSSSILTLTVMTVDRYLAIVPDVKRPLSRKNVLRIILAILIFSFGLSTFNLIKMNTVSNVYSEEKRTLCLVNNDADVKPIRAEYVILFIFFYAFPVFVMSVLYFFIIRFLWLRKIPGNKTNQNEKQRRKHLRKVTSMLVTMATSFAVTWFPVHVAHYYVAYSIEWTLPDFVHHLLFWSAHTNCATNPCFYLIFIKDYRDDLQRVRCCCRNSQTENRPQEINLQ